ACPGSIRDAPRLARRPPIGAFAPPGVPERSGDGGGGGGRGGAPRAGRPSRGGPERLRAVGRRRMRPGGYGRERSRARSEVPFEVRVLRLMTPRGRPPYSARDE